MNSLLSGQLLWMAGMPSHRVAVHYWCTPRPFVLHVDTAEEAERLAERFRSTYAGATSVEVTEPAVYRATPADAWLDCEIVGRQEGGIVLREVGKAYAGVWLADPDQVRIAGPIFQFREPFGNDDPAVRARATAAARAGMKRWWADRKLPPMTPSQQYQYRHVRELRGREEALRQVVEST